MYPGTHCALQHELSNVCTIHPAAATTWPGEVLSSLLRLAFQNLLQEEDSSVRTVSQQLWQRLLEQLSPDVLAQALPAHVTQVRSPKQPGVVKHHATVVYMHLSVKLL